MINLTPENKRIPEFSPIWFQLNQKFRYRDKYTGAPETIRVKDGNFPTL